MADAAERILNMERTKIEFSTEELLKELEIIKAGKENEILAENSASAKRECAALERASEMIAEQAERENITDKNYDEAIGFFTELAEKLEFFDHYAVWDKDMPTIKAGLNALKTLKELQIKVKNHNMIGER